MKKLLTLLLALAIAAAAHAQLLYKVDAGGVTSYLIGSHHLAPASAVAPDEVLDSLLASVDRLYGEIDLAQTGDPAAIWDVQRMMTAPPDSTLDVLLTPAQLDSLSAAFDRYGGCPLPVPTLYLLKPAMAGTFLAQLSSVRAAGSDSIPADGYVDGAMQLRARRLGVEVAGLETLAEQARLLYGTPVAQQRDELLQMISDLDACDASAAELIQAYYARDLDAVLRLIDADGLDSTRLIYERNAAWLSRLVAEMPHRRLMVVVGAGHLPGPQGLIAGLRRAGFSVTPVGL